MRGIITKKCPECGEEIEVAYPFGDGKHITFLDPEIHYECHGGLFMCPKCCIMLSKGKYFGN